MAKMLRSANNNSKTNLIAIVLAVPVFLIVLLFGAVWIRYDEHKKEVATRGSSKAFENGFPTIAAKDSFYDKKLLFSAVDKAQKTTPEGNVFAVISPHHFVAAEFMAEILKSASGRKINTVAIVGPNHFNISNEAVASAKVNWQTPYGPITVDEQLTGRLLTDFHLTENPDAFGNEHSVGAIVPFVKYYFPQAKVVPVILSSYAGQKEAEEVSQWLVDNIGEDGLVIFSIDFSHYLTKERADEKDEVTRQMISDREVGKIIRFNNDYVDCPPALAMSLLYAQKKGLSTEIVRHGNSFDFAQEKPSRTTSYFTVRFFQE
jgi:MEMO1 family protein